MKEQIQHLLTINLLKLWWSLGGRNVSWEDAVLTVLSGLIAGLLELLIEWWRESRRLRERHFEDIKRRCLEPFSKNFMI